MTLMEQNDSQQRSELNFWNGKVTNMKRDMDFQQDFNVKLADENQQLRCDVECLKKHLEMRDKEQNLLNRQINGLKEDNTRIAKMYQLVSDVKQGKPISEDAAPAGRYETHKKADKAEQLSRRGWKVSSEDIRGGGDTPGSLADTMHRNDRFGACGGADTNRRTDPQGPTTINTSNDEGHNGSQFEQKVTLKR